MSEKTYVRALYAAGLLAFTGCMEPPPIEDSAEFRSDDDDDDDEKNDKLVAKGEKKFNKRFSKSNDRACSDCHVAEDAFGLSPEHVDELLANDPDNPLFVDFDADVRGTDNPTFNNLSHGLARVLIPLPDNMDVIDFGGNVVTPPDRVIEVWRAVPSVLNVASAGPLLYDGRAATLEEQALGAINLHAERTKSTKAKTLEQIAAFQKAQFSSDRAQFVAEQLAAGVAAEDIPIPENDPDYLASLTPEQSAGKQVFDFACAGCHGTATQTIITDRDIHDALCFNPRPDGNLNRTFTDLNGNDYFDPFLEGATLTFDPFPGGCDEFVFLGITAATVLAQVGAAFEPVPDNITADFPAYRFRFYYDDERTEQWTDLPPLPVFDEFGLPGVDEQGVPIAGIAGGPIPFTTDPGRALITGNPSDFEGFDMPQLRGIADTAPYFHDNTLDTLEEVVDLYSRAILPAIPGGFFPPLFPTAQPNFFPGESLSDQEKADLVAYLEIL